MIQACLAKLRGRLGVTFAGGICGVVFGLIWVVPMVLMGRGALNGATFVFSGAFWGGLGAVGGLGFGVGLASLRRVSRLEQVPL